MKVEYLEKRTEKRVEERVIEIKSAPLDMDAPFELRLSPVQAEQLTEKGYKVYYRELKSQWVDKPLRVYFIEVNTEDLLKLLPR